MLTDEDREYLESTGLHYETKRDGEFVCLIIYSYPLPTGYGVASADLLLRLPNGFPDAAPDMFWFCPEVLYAGGSGPQATEVRLQFDGRVWQRWSRHLATAWRPGIDNLQTYVRLIRNDLSAGVTPALAA